MKIKGDSFAGRYKRVNDYPIDTTDIWDTYNHALVYARNTDSVAYVPYAGQIISVVEMGRFISWRKMTAYRKLTVRNILNWFLLVAKMIMMTAIYVGM